MATTVKVQRVANPRRKKNYRRAKNAVRNSKGRFVKAAKRKTNPKRKAKAKSYRTRRTVRRKANSTPRIKRYSVKTLKKELKRRGVKSTSNPRRKRHYRRNTRKAVNRRRNPVLIELGAINPRKRRTKNVATRKYRRSRNPRRRRHVMAATRTHRRRRTASNPTRRRTYRRRRNPVAVTRRRRRVGRRSYRRNPSVFGRSGGKDLLMMVGGGLIGVAATKFLPSLIPASITASLGSSPIMGVALTAAGAFAASWIASKVSKELADSVLFGGLMQAGSVLLTAFAPAAVARQLALSGMGDIVPGWFAVPQNPVTARAPMAVVPSANGGGMGAAAFPRAFGRR